MADNAGAATDAAAGRADSGTGVSDASATSGQAAPMADASAEATEAQRAEGGEVQDGPSEEALRQYREDQEWIREHPNEPHAREANPAVGGESFDYLATVSEGVHPDNAPDVPADDKKDNG